MSSKIVKSRKRRISELDGLKSEVTFRYCVQGWSARKIRADLEENYGVTITQKHLEYRINNIWKLRKNLKAAEYEKIDQQLCSRETSGKESEVTLNGVPVSEDRLQRGRKRITFTEQIMRKEAKKQIMAPLETAGAVDVAIPVEVKSPAEWNTLFLLPYREILPSTLSRLPISHIGNDIVRVLEKFIILNTPGHFELSTVRTTPVFSFLWSIIYFVSNNISFGGYDGRLHRLLNKVDEIGCQAALINLLSQKAISIVFARANLLPVFYLRGNDRLLKFAREVDTMPYRALYQALYDCMQEKNIVAYPMGYAKYIKPRHIRRIKWDRYDSSHNIRFLLETMELRGVYPRNGKEARLLLHACKHVDNIPLFFRFWDQKVVTLEDIDDFSDFPHDVCVPLCTSNLRHLNILLEQGFTVFGEVIFLKALIQGDAETATSLQAYFQFDGAECIRQATISPIAIEDPKLFGAVLLATGQQRNYFKYEIFPIWQPENEKTDVCEEPLFTTYAIAIFSTFCELPSGFLDICLEILNFGTRQNPKLLSSAMDFVLSQLMHEQANIFTFVKDISPEAVAKAVNMLWNKGISFQLQDFNVWRALIWRDDDPVRLPDWGSDNHFLLETLSKAQIDPRKPVSPHHGSRFFDICTRHKKHPVTECPQQSNPLQEAYSLDSPLYFVYLLSVGADIAGLQFATYDSVQMEWVHASLEMMEAILNKDEESIRGLWIDRAWNRASSLANVHQAVLNNQLLVAKTLWLESSSSELRKPRPLFRIVESLLWVGERLEDSHYAHRLELLELVLKEYNKSVSWALANNPPDTKANMPDHIKYKANYEHFVRLTEIMQNDLRMDFYKLLIELEPQFTTDSEYLDKCWNRRMVEASGQSLQLLKYLVEHRKTVDTLPPFHINWGRCLHSAIGEGKIDVVRYVLENGADINSRIQSDHALDQRTAVELAVGLGRVDIVSLFLEIDPSCQESALEAVPEACSFTNFMREYIQKWTPESIREVIEIAD